MPVPYYDNLEATPIDGVSCMVEVERVYGLDCDRFDDGHWQALTRIYEGLPGTVRHRDGPMWFGDDDDVPPFVWASVEPSGAGLRRPPGDRLMGGAACGMIARCREKTANRRPD